MVDVNQPAMLPRKLPSQLVGLLTPRSTNQLVRGDSPDARALAGQALDTSLVIKPGWRSCIFPCILRNQLPADVGGHQPQTTYYIGN